MKRKLYEDIPSIHYHRSYRSMYKHLYKEGRKVYIETWELLHEEKFHGLPPNYLRRHHLRLYKHFMDN